MKNLREKIKELFPLEPKPKYTFKDYATNDNFEENLWSDWSQIDNALISKAPDIFALAPPNDTIYYIPRYMIYILDDIDGKITDASDGADNLVTFLLRHRLTSYEKLNLNNNQITFIEFFLDHIYSYQDYKITIDIFRETNGDTQCLLNLAESLYEELINLKDSN